MASRKPTRRTVLAAAAALSAAVGVAPVRALAGETRPGVARGAGFEPRTTSWRRSTVTVGDLPPFVVEQFPLAVVKDEQLPLQVGAIALVPGNRPLGEDGIVRYRHRITRELHDHPVVQATHVMGWLENHRRIGDRRLLDLAVRHGHHLIGTAERTRGALFFPYPFTFALHGDEAETLAAGWFSGMAQGEVLAAFLRLHRITGDRRFAEAAEGTFESFLAARAPGVPWVSDVIDGRLWLEEYADDEHQDRAYNGHNFGLFGIYEYWRETRRHDAATVLRGTITAALDQAGRIRAPGELSHYCIVHDVRSTTYHGIHIRQLYAINAFTGDRRFAQWGDRFLSDAPSQVQGGVGRLAWGEHLLLTRGSDGAVTAKATVAPRRAQTVRYDARQRIVGRDGIWLRMADGPYRGRWVRERPGRAFVSGEIERLPFLATRAVGFAAGAYDAYRLGDDGVLRPARRVVLHRASGALARARTVVAGAPYVVVDNGVFAGLLVPLDWRVTLR